MTAPKPDPAEPFTAYAAALWGEHWAIVRDTERNRRRYGRCVRPSEYRQADHAWRMARYTIAAERLAQHVGTTASDAVRRLTVALLDAAAGVLDQ